jgi:phage terminase small subunit
VAFELDEHHLRLLTLACEAWDRAVQSRELIARHGLTYQDRFGCPKARPEVAIERDSRIAFARLLREIGLDAANIATVPRPFPLRANDGTQKRRAV